MKSIAEFRCTACDHRALKWQGRCDRCGEWGTVAEIGDDATLAAVARPITEIDIESAPRTTTGFDEVDRVVGGGLVAGSTLLVGGDPGIGKSTLMTMLAYRLAARGEPVLYVTGEESAAQVRLRAMRVGALDERLHLLATDDLGAILGAIEATAPAVCIVDSVQTVHCSDVAGVAGTVTQVRAATAALTSATKHRGTTLFLIGHVTKDGSLAGPRTLEHAVDVVLNFDGDRYQSFRMLRALKNRFGAAGEVAVLEMAEDGLVEVPNPSHRFLRGRQRDAAGSVIAPAIVGSRPFLIELQALVAPAPHGAPRRALTGVDPKRTQLVLAILERTAGHALASQDVYVNAVGGLHVDEPAADLPLALAVASAASGRAVAPDLVALGELGLMGEVRDVARLDVRLAEAARFGCRRALVPPDSAKRGPVGVELAAVSSLAEALDLAGVA